jgi:hypothetical protein
MTKKGVVFVAILRFLVELLTRAECQEMMIFSFTLLV